MATLIRSKSLPIIKQMSNDNIVRSSTDFKIMINDKEIDLREKPHTVIHNSKKHQVINKTPKNYSQIIYYYDNHEFNPSVPNWLAYCSACSTILIVLTLLCLFILFILFLLKEL